MRAAVRWPRIPDRASGARIDAPRPRLLANPPPLSHIRNLSAFGGFMIAHRSRNLRFGLMLVAALSVMLLPTAGRAYTQQEQQACSGDAFRLCSQEIPDVDRVTVCMIRHQSELSPGCRVFFRPSEPELAPAAAGRPLSIRALPARKPAGVKPHKTKKPAKPAAN
jgi:hypothetical protein